MTEEKKEKIKKIKQRLKETIGLEENEEHISRRYGEWIAGGFDKAISEIEKKLTIALSQLGIVFYEMYKDIKLNSFYLKDALMCIEETKNKTTDCLIVLLKNKKQDFSHFRERILQNLLAKYPQIIESGLIYLEEEYKLGDTNYRGDLLFLDSNSKRLNVELKVIIPNFNDFTNQMTNYLENIADNERIMYIAPTIREEQEQFCNENNIEIKIIDLNEILKW